MSRRAPYRGSVRAVIFDWAGTTVDYGSRAPVCAFTELFRRHGIEVSVEEARRPMGAHKREHIRQMLESPEIAARVDAPCDLEALYREFIPLQVEVVARHADLIPGTIETAAALRGRGIAVGSTTGYTTEIMSVVLAESERAGFRPDCTVCADEVPAGRPAPWMALQAAMLLGAYPVEACVKVGDTFADIEEGLNAGMWTIGVTRTGNELGLSPAEISALPPAELAAKLEAASTRLLDAGAHFVVEGIAELMPAILSIEERLRGGEKP